MKETIKGKAWKFGDDINADKACQLYENVGVDKIDINETEKFADFCMTGYDPEFPKKVKRGDILVAGKNFACGGHLHAPFYLSFKAVGMRWICSLAGG